MDISSRLGVNFVLQSYLASKYFPLRHDSLLNFRTSEAEKHENVEQRISVASLKNSRSSLVSAFLAPHFLFRSADGTAVRIDSPSPTLASSPLQRSANSFPVVQLRVSLLPSHRHS